jgi:HPt (histidine-containing phosphotransfer) domain-containing protein
MLNGWDYLSKPIKQADLKAMIEKWIPLKIENMINPTDSKNYGAVIDPARIAEIMELGDKGLLVELLTLYLDDGESALKDIETGLKRNDAVLLRESSHKLKGSSANLGIKNLQKICSSIEECARISDFKNAEPLLKPLIKEFENVRRYIRTTYSI